jgi:large repetitive protein
MTALFAACLSAATVVCTASGAQAKPPSAVGAVLWVGGTGVKLNGKSSLFLNCPGACNPHRDWNTKKVVATLYVGNTLKATVVSHDVGFRVKLGKKFEWCKTNASAGQVQITPAGILAFLGGTSFCGWTVGTAGTTPVATVGQTTVAAADPVIEVTVTKNSSVVKVQRGFVVLRGTSAPKKAVVVPAGWQSTLPKTMIPATPTPTKALTAPERTSLVSIAAQLPRLTDTTSPTATVNGLSYTSGHTATFTFSASEQGAVYSCGLSLTNLRLCPGSYTSPSLGDGTYTLYVQATDRAGNQGPVAAHTWIVDTHPPVTEIVQAPTTTSATTASFSFIANEPNVQFSCALDSLTFTPCVSPKTYASLTDGSHQFSVRATDPAGNVGEPVSQSWLIDTAIPNVTISTMPPAMTPQTSASFSFSAVDKASTVTFTCTLDGSAPTLNCPSPASYSGLSDGTHTFTVSSRNSVGSTGQASYTWTVDSRPPKASISNGPPSATYSNTATFALLADEQNVSFECRLDGSAFQRCSGPGTATYTGLSVGQHSFGVRAIDAAGNVGPEQVYSWTVRSLILITINRASALLQPPSPR